MTLRRQDESWAILLPGPALSCVLAAGPRCILLAVNGLHRKERDHRATAGQYRQDTVAIRSD